jgi:glutaredoxin-like YruB-family protein
MANNNEKQVLKEVHSHRELLENINDKERAYLLLYKKAAEQSNCAYENMMQIAAHFADLTILAADVTRVRDIHPEYNITSAPALLEFLDGVYNKTVIGCHKPDFYKTVIENKAFTASKTGKEKTAKRVTVYSTPTCPHCNTLKEYLKKMNIRFTDIDVSKDQQKAQELVQRTGQQGVPQTNINGQFIIGFDKQRINKLLEINA